VHKPQVALMDYRLPGLDGIGATRALKAACPDVAVVALTASANREEMQALRDAGAVACLTKDTELEDIVKTIHEAAASR
jgi:CheY-like chemotaxis protein